MEATQKEIELYATDEGRLPFQEWFDSLKSSKTQAIVDARLARVRLGTLGQTNAISEGVQELKIDVGPGYRVYFGMVGRKLVILLCGGDKSTQKSDVKRAV